MTRLPYTLESKRCQDVEVAEDVYDYFRRERGHDVEQERPFLELFKSISPFVGRKFRYNAIENSCTRATW